MRTIEAIGKNAEEAIRKGLEQLGISRSLIHISYIVWPGIRRRCCAGRNYIRRREARNDRPGRESVNPVLPAAHFAAFPPFLPLYSDLLGLYL